MTHGELQDGDDAAGFRAPPPPDDRLWRHPSELAWSAPSRPRVWPIAVAAVAFGGALAFGVLDAAEQSWPTPVGSIALTPAATPASSGVVTIEDAAGGVVGQALLFRTDGHAVAAAHVVAGLSGLSLLLGDGRRVAARVVGVHDETDVAVMKADVDGPVPTVPPSRQLLALARTPVDVALVVAADITATGHPVPCWLGVSGTDGSGGIDLEEIVPGSPAEEAGLRTGDVLLALEGRPVRSVDELHMALYRWHAGQRVRVTYRRSGIRGITAVVLAPRPPP